VVDMPDRANVHMRLRTLEFTLGHVSSPFLSADCGLTLSS
jgi:hypothetical protein